MPREVSRRTSGPPEWKGAIRPDVVGLKDLPEHIVEDRPDHLDIIERQRLANLSDPQAAQLRAENMDRYYKTLSASEGPSKQKNDGVKPMPRVLKGRVPNGQA